MIKNRLHLACIALVCAVFVAGCQTMRSYPSSARGTYELKRKLPNRWEALVDQPVVKAHRATMAGLKDLNINAVTSQVDQISGMVEAVFGDGMDLEVKLESVAPNITRISIRCGMVGDRDRSRMVFSAIEKRL